MKPEIIIIGAGAAGLRAAYELTKTGIKPLILEARNRVGGRIYTSQDKKTNSPIELGAEFVHGKPPETFNLVREAKLKVVETDGESWHIDQNGKLSPSESNTPQAENIIWKKLEAFDKEAKEDISVKLFLDNLSTELEDKENFADARRSFERYIAGFHAAELEKIGVKSLMKTEGAEEEIEGERGYHLIAGYNRLTDYLFEQAKNAGAVFHLDRIVKRIKWRSGNVEIIAEKDGQEEVYTANAAIITLPLGVLKAALGENGAVSFEPPLVAKQEALQQVEMGAARRVVFTFKTKWWVEILSRVNADKSQLGFLFAPNEKISVWWTNEPAATPMLTGWTGGKRAFELSQFSDEEVINQALESLCKTFQVERSFLENEIVSSYTFDWQNEPFARGSYSYIGVGGIDAPRRLAAAVENTLFFAGEATNFDGHWGTVHGALASGIRVAEQVIADKIFS